MCGDVHSLQPPRLPYPSSFYFLYSTLDIPVDHFSKCPMSGENNRVEDYEREES